MGRPIVTLGGAPGQNINLGQSNREPHKLGHQRGGGRCAQKRARYLTPNAFGGRRTASESTGCRRLSMGPSCGVPFPSREKPPERVGFYLLRVDRFAGRSSSPRAAASLSAVARVIDGRLPRAKRYTIGYGTPAATANWFSVPDSASHRSIASRMVASMFPAAGKIASLSSGDPEGRLPFREIVGRPVLLGCRTGG